MNFYEKHTLFHRIRIQSVERIYPREGQPSFINFLSINGEEVAFLGTPIKEPDQLLNKFIRVDRMVIPEFARMLRPKALINRLASGKDAIEINDDTDFYEGRLEHGVILNVAGMLTECIEHKKHFHACHNYRRSLTHEEQKEAFQGLPLFVGRENCHWAHLDFNVYEGPAQGEGDEREQKISYHLPVFYLSAADFKASDERALERWRKEQEDGIGNPDPPIPIEDNLKWYFERPDAPEAIELLDGWKHVLGIFLIPTLTPGQQIIYFCLPNAEGSALARLQLMNWSACIRALNQAPTKKEIYVSVNDLTFAGIDEWSVTLGKSMAAIVGKKEDWLQGELLEGVLC